MGGMRRIILDVLQGLGTKSISGGFWVDGQGNLIENYEEDDGMQPFDLSDDVWLDEQGNPLSNYMGENEGEMEEIYRGIEPQEHKDDVSAGDLWNTAQRGGA